MNVEDMLMEELTPKQAARALGVSQRTVYFWLDTGVLDGKQGLTGRRLVTVGALLDLVRKRAKDRDTEEQFRHRLETMLSSQSSLNTGDTRTGVLCS